MAADAAQAGQLIFDRRQVLEWSERQCHQPESSPQLELAHIARHKPDLGTHFLRFVLKFSPADIQHMWREVQPGDLDPGPGGRDQNPPRSAADLKNRSA